MGGSMGCVVTGNKLFSQGRYIRDLNSKEMNELLQYKAELKDFNKKIADAMRNVDNIAEKNSTIPSMPVHPQMPNFCSGPDTVLYIFPGCTVQNNKVYVGYTYARELNVDERKKLNEFARQMAQEGATTTNVKVNSMQSTTISPAAAFGKTLDFCNEL